MFTHGRVWSKDVLIVVMQKRKVIRSERRVRSLEKEHSCKGKTTVNAQCLTFNVPTSDGRREYRGTFLAVTWAGVIPTGLKAPRYSTIHDTLPPNALHLYERDPRCAFARGAHFVAAFRKRMARWQKRRVRARGSCLRRASVFQVIMT